MPKLTWVPVSSVIGIIGFAVTDKPGCYVIIPLPYSRAPAFNFRDTDRLLWQFLWLYFPQKNSWAATRIRIRPIPYKPLLHLLLIILYFDTIQPEIGTNRQRRWPDIRERTNWLYCHYLWNSVYRETVGWGHAKCWKHAKPRTKLSVALLLRTAQTGKETGLESPPSTLSPNHRLITKSEHKPSGVLLLQYGSDEFGKRTNTSSDDQVKNWSPPHTRKCLLVYSLFVYWIAYYD